MERQPLAKVAVPVAALAGLLALLGVQITTDQVDAVTTAITVLTPIVSPLLVWLIGRRKVTPLDSPRSATGVPLVPVE